MIHTIDKELKGHSLCFNDPLEVIDMSIKGNKECKFINTNWDKMRKTLVEPKKSDMDKVDAMIDAIKESVPPPKSRKRKVIWTEDSGEIDVDRAMRGELNMFRDSPRLVTSGPVDISLLCNMDGNGDPFIRGAAAIAAADLLEEAGYGCEMLMWCRGSSVFPQPYPNQFVTCKLKDMGTPIDMNSISCALTIRFLYYGVFGSFAACPIKPKSIGGANYTLGGWIKYMDVTPGIMQVQTPVTWNINTAIEKTKEMLEKIFEGGYDYKDEYTSEYDKRVNK